MKRALRILAIFTICSVVSFITLKTLDRIWTGDEPRYFYYSTSFFENCQFTMPEEIWRTVLLKTGVPYALNYWPSTNITGTIPSHSVFVPMLLSQVTGHYSLSGGRIAILLIGLVGVWAIFHLCLRYFNTSHFGNRYW